MCIYRKQHFRLCNHVIVSSKPQSLCREEREYREGLKQQHQQPQKPQHSNSQSQDTNSKNNNNTTHGSELSCGVVSCHPWTTTRHERACWPCARKKARLDEVLRRCKAILEQQRRELEKGGGVTTMAATSREDVVTRGNHRRSGSMATTTGRVMIGRRSSVLTVGDDRGRGEGLGTIRESLSNTSLSNSIDGDHSYSTECDIATTTATSYDSSLTSTSSGKETAAENGANWPFPGAKVLLDGDGGNVQGTTTHAALSGGGGGEAIRDQWEAERNFLRSRAREKNAHLMMQCDV